MQDLPDQLGGYNFMIRATFLNLTSNQQLARKPSM